MVREMRPELYACLADAGHNALCKLPLLECAGHCIACGVPKPFGNRLVDALISNDGKDNGVMIVVSMGDRKWSLQSGYGVEHALTDGTLGEIGRRVMRPRFRQNQYYTGLDEATTEIMQRLSGEFKPSKSKKTPFWIKLIPLLFIALIAFLIDKLGNRGGGNYTSMHSGRRRTSRHGSSWRSSPGSSSSWGGFGGGSFGGGGASGGW